MSDDEYREQKLEDRGYPGLGPTTSQADEMAKKVESGMYSIKASPVGGAGGMGFYLPPYKDHVFEPSQHGLIGAPCVICGGLPTDPGHTAFPIKHEYLYIGPGGGGTPTYHDGTRDNCPDQKCREYVKAIRERDAKMITGTFGVPPAKVLEIADDPAVWVERTSPNSATYEFREIPNEQAYRIITEILPGTLELYLKKSKDYGGNVMDRFNLGQKAAIPDMARKFGKLIDSIWHGKKLAFEQEDEILQDLLGHILIILDQRKEGK